MARTRWRQPNTKDELTGEAAQVLGAVDEGLDIFTEPGSADSVTYGFLAEVTRRMRPLDWNENPTRAFKWVMASAVGKLPDTNPDKKDPFNYKTSWRDVGMTVCGLREDLNRNYDGNPYKPPGLKRVAENESEAQLSPKSHERRLYVLYEMLADILREMHPATFRGPDTAPMYIYRPELEEAVNRAVIENKHIIFIHGEAGTGKSTLAERVAGRLSEPTTILARTPQELSDSIVDALTAAGSPPKNTDIYSLRREFRRLLASENSPAVTIVDDVPADDSGEDLLHALLPEHLRGRVFVTSTRASNLPESAALIKVGNMKPAEAEQMVRSRIPGLSDREIARLATALDCRPLAIEHGCACVADERSFNSDVESFCLSLPLALDNYMEKPGERILTAVYRITIDQLKKQDIADTLLFVLDAAICFGPVFQNDFESLLRIVYPSSGRSSSREISSAAVGRINKAVHILESRSLLHPNATYVMHGLTVKILAMQRKESLVDMLVDGMRRIYQNIDEPDWPGGCPPSATPLSAVGYISNAFVRIGLLPEFERKIVLHELGDVGEYLFARCFRKFRQEGLISLDVFEAFLWYMRSGEDARPPSSGVLNRELLESGYIDLLRTENEGSMKDRLVELDRRLVHFTAVPASLFNPIGHYNELADLIEHDTVNFNSHWIFDFQYDLFHGISNMHLGNWDLARSYLVSCLEYCNKTRDVHKQAYIMQLICIRSLIELETYSQQHVSMVGYLSSGNSILQDMVESEDSAVRQPDPINLNRYFLATAVAHLEGAMYAMTSSDERINQCLEIIEEKMSKLEDLATQFAKAGLFQPALECRFHRLRAAMWLDSDHESIAAKFAELSQLFRSADSVVGEYACDLAVMKLSIGHVDEIVLSSFCERIFRMTEPLMVHKAAYWLADAINTLYAIELVRNVDDDNTVAVCNLALELLNRIDRPDRLHVAELVKESPAASLLLLRL
ncbi:AAA family ATPase [Nocardia fluminea]